MEEYYKYIPVALYVLYLLFGRGKKSKEKGKPAQRRPQQREEKRGSGRTLEDILRKLEEEAESQFETVAKPVRKKERINPESKSRINIVDHQNDNVADYSHHADTGRTMAQIRAEMDRASGKDKETVGMEVDLRQAVIYDAILNRPYD